jgi:CRISPR-associated protein Csb2
MLAMEIEYLMGRVVASAHNDRTVVEWPPHPTRLFSALVAAYSECDLGDSARAALEWLETLPEPRIYAKPPEHGGSVRDIHGVFVPVNDSSQIPESRPRQVRWFPAFTPEDSHVWFIWNDAPEAERHTGALQRVAENVTYLGHSMSPVRVRVSDAVPEPTLIPDHAGNIMLRTTGKGRLSHLEGIYRLRKDNTTIQPGLGRVTRYRSAAEVQVNTPESLFRHVFVFERVEGPKLPAESAAKLAGIVRKAVIGLYPDPVPEVISGHMADGKQADKPHLAVTPLPDVAHRYADGHIMGFALWLPSDVQAEILETLEDALAGLDSLTLGKYGVWKIGQVSADIAARAAAGLRFTTYTKPHHTWASVTPVVFGKFPKKSQTGPGKDGGKIFGELCELIGLPRPIEVRLGPVGAFHGSPKASECVPSERFANRLRAHIVIRFAEPVQGPVLMGAGRYAGFGLCRPLLDQRAYS